MRDEAGRLRAVVTWCGWVGVCAWALPALWVLRSGGVS